MKNPKISSHKNTLCLVMIVKNEAKNLPRCFSSIKNIIDYWVIVDTGSTDNTIDVIKEELKDIPGDLYERPWVNFGHNRTESISLAQGKSDYILLCDADEQILPSNEFDKSKLDKDQYQIRYMGSLDYVVPYLIKNGLSWRFVGVTHEYLTAPEVTTTEIIDSIKIKDWGDGGSKSNKFERDIDLLETGLVDEPGNVRYMFYLANSYKNVQNWYNAIKWYKKRIEAGGWKEEVTCSYEYIGGCFKEAGDIEGAFKYWLEGYNYNPKRAECIYEAGKLMREEGRHVIAYDLLKIAKNIPYPKNDILFIKKDVYDFLIDYEIGIVAYYVDHNDIDMLDHYRNLLFNSKYHQNNIIQNFKFYAKNIEHIIGKSLKSYNVKDLLNDSLLEGFTPSSPSLLKVDDHMMINVRQVSYKINDHGQYLDRKTGGECKHVNTVNTRIDWGTKLPPFNYIPSDINQKHVNGIEDLKIFKLRDKIMYTGTKWIDYGNIQIVYGEYSKNGLENYQIIPSPENRKVEKNWVPFVYDNTIHFIYDYSPLRFYKLEDGELKDVTYIPTNYPNLRGSSPGKYYNGKYYFVTHFVEYKQPRIYYHCILELDLENKETQISKPFVFEKPQIEYCVGLEFTHDSAFFAYSVNDSNAKIKKFSLEQFENLFK